MTDSASARQLASKHLLGNYGERELVLVRGEGARVWDTDGREYTDFLAGISVNNLGHCHPAVTEAIVRQAATLVHCSNLYLIPQQAELAELLCGVSFAERCFFANSGAEVNEAAIKLARLWSKTRHGAGRHVIITMRNSFHGRTMATITATGQEKVQKGFEPLLEGFRYADFNDLPSVVARMDETVCAVMVEPVQGEGGVTAADPGFLRGLRSECTARGILLVFDEVQCGMARTGRMFAHEHYGIAPDIMTLAKALGNGMPIGAMLTTDEIAQVMGPGTHGTTFGGNPMVTAAALAVLRTMVEQDIPARAAYLGEYFRKRLAEELGGYPNVVDFRGLGLMVGIGLTHPGAQVVKECVRRGLLINCTMGNVLRMLPPLTVTETDCDRVTAILAEVLALEEIRGSAEASAAAAAGSSSNSGGKQ